MISSPPSDGSSNELCDWLELAALASQNGSAYLAEINADFEMEEDFEDEDPAHEDELREQRVQKVLAAMDEREQAMGAAYPFELERSGSSMVLKNAISKGGNVYLFCLIVSNAAEGGLLDGTVTPDLKQARILFQACATVSSAGFIGGPAYSTGWPRPDRSSFLQKLKQVYGRFQDGKVHATPPSWAPPKVKDDEIDVIAFKHEPDQRAATLYFIGQAASGANWREKSVKNAIALFHSTWFVQPPASTPNSAMIIPFCLPSSSDGNAADHESQERIEGEFWRTALKMGGVLLYRNRVALNIDKAVYLADNGIGPIESIDQLDQVQTYVSTYRGQLQTAAMATT